MLKRLAVTVGDGAGEGAGARDAAEDGARDAAEAGGQLSRIWPALDTCHAGQLFSTCNEK